MYIVKKIIDDSIVESPLSLNNTMTNSIDNTDIPVDNTPSTSDMYELSKIVVMQDENGSDVNIPQVVAQTSLDELNTKLTNFQGIANDIQAQIDAINSQTNQETTTTSDSSETPAETPVQ